MSPISVYIEMPEYFKKYLLAVSENKQEPVEFTPKHDYYKLLSNLCVNYPVHPVDRTKNVIKIKLPFNRIKDVYFYNKLGEEAREFFRAQVKRDLYYDFRVFLKDSIMSGMQRKVAIEKFFLAHNITEDDIQYDSFYRNYSRYLAKKRIKFCV